jgi:hypothetical protein
LFFFTKTGPDLVDPRKPRSQHTLHGKFRTRMQLLRADLDRFQMSLHGTRRNENWRVDLQVALALKPRPNGREYRCPLAKSLGVQTQLP